MSCWIERPDETSMRSDPSRRQLAKLTGTTGRGPHWIGRRISAFALNAKRPMDRPPTIRGDMRFREWIRLAETEEDRAIRYRMSNKLICLSTWKTTSSLRISVHGPRFHCTRTGALVFKLLNTPRQEKTGIRQHRPTASLHRSMPTERANE